MQLGEAVAGAAALAQERGVDVASIDVVELQRRFIEGGHMVAFFNDLDMATRAPWLSTVQVAGAHGFFDGYDAHPDAP